MSSKLISTSEDAIINVFKLSGKLSSVATERKIDLDSECYQIVSNSTDKLAIGGESKKVDLHTVAEEGAINLSAPALATIINSRVQRLAWVGRHIVVIGEEDEAQVYDTETERVTRFKNDGGVAFKAGALDPLGQYFAGTACDGMLYIFKVPADGEGSTGPQVHKVKITKAKVVPFETNPLEVVWRPDGSELFVTGDLLLGVVTRDTWGLTLNKDYGHKKAITCITWINDTVFATTGLDNVIKIWDSNKR